MPAYLVELDDGRKFRVEADAPPTTEEVLSYLQTPAEPTPEQPGRVGSFASSVGRGALSVVPGTIGGVGYLTGSDTLTEAANTVEGGINRMLPVNPEYRDEFLMKAGGALGQAGGMLLTGGVTGAAGKALALSRGLEAAQAAAKGTQLAQNVLLGTGVLQGTRGGGQAAEQYGMKGGTAYARALLGGAIEGLSERALFGMGTELAPVKKFLGDAAEKGVGGIVKAAGTEAGEEAAAQIGGNVATSVLAPYGVKTPEALAGTGEAALLGAVAGGALGGVNALMQPSPTIEGDAMVPFEQAPEAPVAPEQPETDELGVESFRQEMAQIAQEPDPIEPLKEITTKAAEVSVAQNADVLPATAAVIAAGGLKPAPVQKETPVGAPVVEQPASGVLLPEPTPVEAPVEPVVEARPTQEELMARMRAALANQPVEQEPELEQPQPEPPVVKETVPPVEPIPAVEEAPAAPVAEEQFPKVENVVAPAGDTEVGLEMDKLNTAFDTLFQLPPAQKRNLSAMREKVIAKMDEIEALPYDSKLTDARDKAFTALEKLLIDIDTERLSQSKGSPPKARKPYVGPSWSEGRPTVAEAEAYLTEQFGPEAEALDRLKDPHKELKNNEGWWDSVRIRVRNGEPRGRALVEEAMDHQKITAEDEAAAQAAPEKPMTYGRKYIADQGVEGAIARINHLRERLEEENKKKNQLSAENLADEIDRIANALVEENPDYDWVSNTVKSKAPPPQAQPVAEKQAAETQGKAETPKVKLTPEEQAALKLSKRKGVENRGDGIFFIPEKLPQRDTSKPEQMTPEEVFAGELARRVRIRTAAEDEAKFPKPADKQSRIDWVNARKEYLWKAAVTGSDIPTDWIRDMPSQEWAIAAGYVKQGDTFVRRRTDRPPLFGISRSRAPMAEADALESLEKAKQDADLAARSMHGNQVNEAVWVDNKPVSKAAVDAYGITLPEGYVAEGELYVYRPDGGKEFGSTNTEGSIPAVTAEKETPKTEKSSAAEGASILKKEVDNDSGEINYHVGIPKDAAYALGLAGAWSQLNENGLFVLRSGYARNPKQALDALLWQLKNARSKVLMPTMDAHQEYGAKMEAVEAPIRSQLWELFRPLIREPFNKELEAQDTKGEPAIWLDDQIITTNGKYHFDSNGKLRKDQDLSKTGFEKNLGTIMSADGEGVLWGANKAAKAEIKRIQDEHVAKKAAEAQAAKEKAEKDAQEQADKAAYAEAVEAVVLPKGKKQSIEIKNGTGGVRQEESTVVGSLAYRKNPVKGKDESPYLVTHVPTGLGIAGRSVLSSLSDVTRFLKSLVLSGVDLSKLSFDEAERAKMLEAIVAFRGGAVPSWFSQAKEFGSTNTVVTKEAKDKAAKNLRKKLGGQTNIGLDPSILKDAIAIGAFYIEGGARSFAEFSSKMIEDFGEGVRKYIRPAYDELRKRKDIDTSGMDPEEGGETAPKVEEPKTPTPTNEPAPKTKLEDNPAKGVPAEPEAASPVQDKLREVPSQTAEPATVPIANDPVDAQRVALGLEPIMRQTQEAYTFPQMWADAEAAMAANPERGRALVKSLNDKPRTISALEDAILLRERVNRVNALDLSMVEFNNAPKGNNEVQRKAMDDAITALTELDDALNVAGTEQGRSLNARKMLARLDYSLPKMLTTLRAANDGELSEADVATVTRLQKQLDETQKKIAGVESGQAARIAEAEKVAFEAGRQEVLKDIQDRAKVEAEKIAEMQKRRDEYQKAKKEAATKPNKWAEIREAARARNAELRSNLYSDVVLVKAASMAVNDVIIGATYIAEGVTKLADWVTSMRAEGYNLPDDEMEQLYNESKAFDAGEELPAAEAPLKTKKAKAPVIERVQSIAADGEQLDSRTVYNFVVEKMKERAESSQGAKLLEMSEADLTSVIREVTADVQAYFPDITEREIRDLFSGYGKILMPSQDELSKQIRQLSALGKLASAIEDAKAQRAPLKSGPQRDKATQAIRLQQKKLARELRMSGVEYAAGEGQLRSPLDAIKARLNNQINDLALEINTRKKIQRRPSVAYDKETEDLVKLRDELKSISDDVNKPAGPTFAELVSEEMKKLDARISELQKTLDEGKFAPKQDTTLYTQELQAKRDERDRLSKLVSKARKEAIGDVRTQDEIDRAAIKDAKDAIAELERKLKEKDFKRPERRTPTETAEYKALTEEKDRLQKLVRDERLKAEGRQGMSDEQRIKLATAAIDKSMARIQEMLASGNYEVPKRVSKTPETPELKAKREARDALRKRLIELRKMKRDAAIDPIAKQIATDKKRIQTRMRKLKERMDKGDFSKPAKRQKATDEALLALQVEEEKLKEEWAKMVFERQLASRGPGKKILDATQQTLNTARAVLTSADVSAVFRQGGFIVLGNPMRGLRNLGPMFKAFSSEEFAKADKFRLQNRENYKNGLYQQSKLFLADTGKVNQMTAQEEAFMSRWIDKIPKGIKGAYLGSVLRGSQRAYTVFLNRLRADSFDAMVANLKKGSEPTPQEVKAVADYINIATGRGDLGKFNQAGTMLNTVFFAPRLVASRFQILAGYPYFTASGRTKALVLREYAKFLTGAALVYALGMLAQDDEDEPIETDPRSSDFGKIRFGDTRVDPLSGLIQATVLLSRLATGEKKTANGKIVAIRGAEVPYGADTSFDVMANFLRTKLSPIVGSAVNVLEGKNVVGEPTDVTEELQRMVIPMSFTEMKETFEAQGVPEATALTILQLFGMGVQTYTPGKK